MSITLPGKAISRRRCHFDGHLP